MQFNDETSDMLPVPLINELSMQFHDWTVKIGSFHSHSNYELQLHISRAIILFLPKLSNLFAKFQFSSYFLNGPAQKRNLLSHLDALFVIETKYSKKQQKRGGQSPPLCQYWDSLFIYFKLWPIFHTQLFFSPRFVFAQTNPLNY